MVRDHARASQRVGMFLTFVEACLFALVAALHLGFQLHVRESTYAAPFLYPAAIIEALIALALFLSLLLPGGDASRAGRVLAAQILAVIGIFAGQIALLRGVALTTARSEIFYGVVLVLALASIVLVAAPTMRSRPVAH